jgi:hypothetical protein
MSLQDHLPRDWRGEPVARPLVDDLAHVLAATTVGWKDIIGYDLSEAPEVKRVMARYRDWKERGGGITVWVVLTNDHCATFEAAFLSLEAAEARVAMLDIRRDVGSYEIEAIEATG